MGGTSAGAGDSRPPILDKIIRKLPPVADGEQAVARKHNCNSVWCPLGCYRRFHLKRHFERLSEIPWDEARFVTLTLDRDKCGEGADAYMYFREKKMLGRFFVSLERLGVKILDWAGQMEFHDDGTPHWHLLVWTEGGKMIGQDKIHQAWPWGRMIREEYFENRKRYENTVGYFGKAGYFHKKKKHQTILPDYFKSDYFQGKKIIRFYSARRPSPDPKERPEPKKEPEKSETITGRKLATCGQFTHIWYYREDEAGFAQSEVGYSQCLNIPYKEFLDQCPGEFVPGFGYAFFLSGVPPEVEPCPF